MSGVTTTLDFSLANGLRARRRLSERAPHQKLAILRRLAKQYVLGLLPRLTESNVEQSWNEQVFASVLGYQTQFAHDRLPFNLKAKNYRGGYYSDFSLGFFGIGAETVIVTAELKGPLAGLDKPQGKKYGGLTPVEQAFRTAATEPTCRWVLVSNFVEVRLYAIDNSREPVVCVHLPDVSDPMSLALMQALLDRGALLGNGLQDGELAMMTKLTPDHPASLIEAHPDEYRVVLRFTPEPEQEVPLFRAEQGLRDAVTKAPGWQRFFHPPGLGRPLLLQSRLADGWVAVDGKSDQNGIVGRIAVSLLGQVQASFRFCAPDIRHDQVQRKQVEHGWIVNALRLFGGLLEHMYDMTNMQGLLGAELREAREKFMHVNQPLLVPHAQNSGVAQIDDIVAGDFRWDGAEDSLPKLAATCACELAAYFRGPRSGIGVSLDAMTAEIDRQNAGDRATMP